MDKSNSSNKSAKVRLDKWLWAARFYKTRAIAKQAIDGGKVHCDGVRAKPGKEITEGLRISLRQGNPQSFIEQRQLKMEQRKAIPRHLQTEGRPSKRDRRLIHQFKNSQTD